MRKITILLMTILMIPLLGRTVIVCAQPAIDDDFFQHVDYIGAFGTENWAQGWANWDPQNTAYGETTETVAPGDITTNTTWTADKIYLLNGWVYVKEGASLTIEPGTIIRGDKAAKGALIVERGAKLIAEGSAENPIVFTSNQAAGSRNYGDWGGLIILGNADVNRDDPVIEGGVGSHYGGTDDADSSGIIKYVRVEFPGIAFVENSEINGITFGGVGSKTVVDYVQVSYSGDDSYEWFGGAVNAKHLIAFKGWDDDFDTDYGFRGKVQFAVSLRDPEIADVSGSNGFESDNDGDGSDAEPFTTPVFSNVSIFGPLATPSTSINSDYRRAMHIRRNSRLSIFNSIFAGYPTGLFIDGDKSQANATAGLLNVNNTYLAAMADFYADEFNETYFSEESRENEELASNDDLQITDPFNLETPDFLPETGSPVLTASIWYEGIIDAVDGVTDNSIITSVYPNPFSESAMITFDLKSASDVSIRVYDVTGTLISTVVNRRLTGGNHRIILNLAGKGIYFAEIMVNKHRQTLKLVSK